MVTETPVQDDVTKSSILDELMDDSTAEETPSKETGDDKIIPDHEVIKPEDDDKETKDEDETELSETEEKTKGTDEEIKLEDKEEDELELVNIPRKKEIEAKYPKIFKDFPQLERALFRNQAFSEVFPTINDAKEAKSSVEEYNNFQSELMGGNIEGVLKSVKRADPKAFDKIAANILDSLVRVDTNSVLPSTRKITKGVLFQINQIAKSNLKKDPNNKQAQQLEIATELIHDSIFNTSEVNLDSEPQVREDPERAKFDKDREDFEKTRYTAAFNTVSGKVNNSLTNAVKNGIDVKGILPEYVKGKVVQDVMSELDRQLGQDKPFRGLIDKLWLKARNENYSSTSMENIEKALKNKAKSILPEIMKAKKGEAMKGLSVKSEKKEVKRELSRNTVEDKRTPQDKELTLNRRDNDKITPRPGESKLDFLMRD